MKRRDWLLMLLSSIVTQGCSPALEKHGKTRPTIVGDKCGIEKKQAAPLIVDWSPGRRDRLEAAVRRKGVVVAKVSACSIQPLWQCDTKARYGYAGSTRRRQTERIADEKSLYTKIPTSAVSFEGKLAAGMELQVSKTTVGRFETEASRIAEADLSGDCEGATHVVSAVAVGAFEFTESRNKQASGEVDAAGAGVGAGSKSEHDLLSADGSVAACEEASPEREEPPAQCGAPIEIELTPLRPSLDVDEFRELLLKGTMAASDKCHHHGVHGTGASLFLLIEPSGHVEPRFQDAGPFAGTPAFGCILDVWRSFKVTPFEGDVRVGVPTVQVYPPSNCTKGSPGCSDREESLRRLYRKVEPITVEKARDLGYDIQR